MDKEFLVKKTEDVLVDNGFLCYNYQGCFDIAARKLNQGLLLKILPNIGSFQGKHAINLKIASSSLEFSAMLIGEKTRKEKLSDNIIYNRFGIPTITLNTLENFLENMILSIHRFRGGLFAKIDIEQLRKERERSGLSQRKLGQRVGVTKKSIYEHEAGKKIIKHENAEKLEEVLDSKLIENFEPNVLSTNEVNEPKEKFHKKVIFQLSKKGFQTKSVSFAPFNIVAKENFVIISSADETGKGIDEDSIKGFSKITEKTIIVISRSASTQDIPCINDRELGALNTSQLKNLIEDYK